MNIDSRHQCLIYEGSPSQQLPRIAALIQRKMNEGYRCLYLNSPPMVAGLRSFLSAIGVNVFNETSQGRLVLSSESITTGDESFDIDLMLQKLEEAIDQALMDGYKGLFATGDMTWEFGAEKNFSKLLEYEYRLEKLFRRREDLCGICQYHKDTLPSDVPRLALLSHQSIYINETISRINPHYLPQGAGADQRPSDAELDKMIDLLCQSQTTAS